MDRAIVARFLAAGVQARPFVAAPSPSATGGLRAAAGSRTGVGWVAAAADADDLTVVVGTGRLGQAAIAVAAVDRILARATVGELIAGCLTAAGAVAHRA